MKEILDLIFNFDFENIDILAIINSLIGLIKSLLGSYIGGEEA